MKKRIFFIFIVLLIISLVVSYRDICLYRVLKVYDANHLYIDINKNGQIDQEELFKIHLARPFTKNDSIVNYNGCDYSFYLNDLTAKWLNNNVLNNRYRIKFINSKEVILYKDSHMLVTALWKNGLSLSENNSYNNYVNYKEISKNVVEANKKKIVIFNSKTNKYHKLDCEFAHKSFQYQFIPFEKLPLSAKSCAYCHKQHYSTRNFAKQKRNTNVPLLYYQDGPVTIYFINFINKYKPSNNCDSLACKALLKQINDSKISIDFAIYGISGQKDIVNALSNAQKRGVKVRWVTDFDSNNAKNNYYMETAKLMNTIKSYKTDLGGESNSNRNYIMHNKFFVFDKKKVFTGSANITDTDLSSFNSNYSVLLDSPICAELYTKEFEQMYNGKFHKAKSESVSNELLLKNSKIKILFSPQDNVIEKDIIPLIDASNKYIYMPVFFFTHKKLADHLVLAHARGVDIRLINDATNSHGKYSVNKYLRDNGVLIKTENRAGKMHMKTIIIDDKYSIVGSMNYTKAGNNFNDENTVIINNKQIAKYMANTFIYLWSSIPDKYLRIDPRAEAPESIGSCEDGIDNNFDGKIDIQDPYCKGYIKYSSYQSTKNK